MADKLSTKPERGYGKRPMSFWVIMYVVIGGIIYTAVYFLFMHHGSSGGGFRY